MKNKGLMILGTLGVIFLIILAPLIVWLFKSRLDSKEKSIVASVLNFEISILIIGIIAKFIPFVGSQVCAILYLINIVYGIMAYMADKDNKPLTPASIYEFVK